MTVGEFDNNGSSEEASNSGAEGQHARLGVSVANLTAELRQQYNVPDNVHGAVIESAPTGQPGSTMQVCLRLCDSRRGPASGGKRRQLRRSSALSAGGQRHPAAGVGAEGPAIAQFIPLRIRRAACKVPRVPQPWPRGKGSGQAGWSRHLSQAEGSRGWVA